MTLKKSRFLIAGGTGLIGTYLTDALEKQGHEVFILTRNKKKCVDQKYRHWLPDQGYIQEGCLDDIEVLINLCGESLAEGRWTEQRKKEHRDSRVLTTEILFEEAQKSGKLKQYITASGINCYPVNTTSILHEEDSYGNDYLSQLVKIWEEAALKFEEICPVTRMRISAVLSPQGGALKKLLPIFKLGAGSPLGSGNQPFTWVHEEDLARAILFVAENKCSGAYNVCGETITNRVFSKHLGKAVNRWMLPVPVPGFVLKLVLGQMSEMLLNGVNVNAEKLQKAGFEFKYPDAKSALENLV